MAANPIPTDPNRATFSYPAPLLIFTLPLVFLEYPTAHFIWLIAIQVFLFAGIYLLARRVGWPGTVNQLTVLLLLSIYFIPNLQNTIWGQFNTIGVISLALAYRALVNGKLLQAGIWTAGLAFKPQTMLLTMVLLMVWAALDRKRWRFLFGISTAGLALWAFAELLEPGWIGAFLRGLQEYADYFKLRNTLTELGLSSPWFAATLLLAAGVLFLLHYKDEAGSPGMVGWIVFSTVVWWLVVPILGMMHLVMLSVILVLLFSALEAVSPKIMKIGIIGMLIIYGLGLAGFLYGLSSPNNYGLHIHNAEIAYKAAAPVLIVFLTLPIFSTRIQNILKDTREKSDMGKI